MKMPKNRANCYVVSRYSYAETDHATPVVGVFAHFDDADDYASACQQEMKDKIGYEGYGFKVDLSTFYG
jgi:hypothetical protein